MNITLPCRYSPEVSRVKCLDYGTASTWDTKNDSRMLEHIFSKIRELRNGNKQDKKKAGILAQEFENKLLRIYNDQTVTEFEPYDVDYKQDLVVITGLVRFAELISGDSTEYFSHYAAGISTQPEGVYDQHLYQEISRVAFDVSGYSTSAGSILKFAGFFPEGLVSATISEGGVFDSADGGDMAFRTVYQNPVVHVQYNDVVTLTQSIQLTSTG